MLDRIIRFSLSHPQIILLAWLILGGLGLVAFEHLSMDAFPDITPVQVAINTVAPALAPLEVERRITVPIEQTISGLPGLENVRSISKFGLSQVTVVFNDETDIALARQVVSERLQTVDMPPGLPRPQLGPVATGLGEIFHYLVGGEGKSLSELRTVQDWVIRPQLRSVSGVAEVNSWGGDERQIHIRIDPIVLARFGLSLGEIATAVEKEGRSVGGGTVDSGGEATLVQGIGLLTRRQDVEEIVVATRKGVPIRIRDIGQVVEGREIRRGAVTASGHGEVVLGLAFMQMGQNSRDVTARLAARVADIRKSLPPGVNLTVVYERTWIVNRVLRTVRKNLQEGALLVVAILFIFLGNLRAGLIVASAIPLSMLFAFSLMERCGIAGSLMSLGAIDFGLVVDSSVIMVENAVRRLAQDHSERSRREVVEEAALEVRKPTMFGELIIAIVYLPVLALTGIEGKLFRPMALTVIFALLGSMIMSLTLMPVLASILLPLRIRVHENLLIRALKALYAPVLRLALKMRWLVLATALAWVAWAGWIATHLGSEFIPRLMEGSICINTVRLAGVSVDESVRYGTRIERLLLEKFPDEIKNIWTRTGTAEVATDPMGLELSDVFLTLKPTGSWKHATTQAELVTRMERELSDLPGMRLVFTQPIEMRVNELVAGIRSDVGFKLFGDDLEVLKTKASEIDALLRTIPGASDVSTEQLTGQPLLQIEVDRPAAARLGVSPATVLETIESLGTNIVSQLQEGDRRFPVSIKVDSREARDINTLGQLLVNTQAGERIPLARLTKMRLVEGPSTVNREWARRRVIVQSNVRDRDVGSFVQDAASAIAAKVKIPPGYYLRFGGQFEHFERARARLMVVVPMALLLIIILLYFTYGRWLDAFRVFTGVPLAAAGGVAALWLRGFPFSISAGVGFVALSGVSVLGDMVLVSTIRQFLDEGMEMRQAITAAAEQRLRPVLMTALVASLGFVPMAVSTGLGAEVQCPLATVVIGGVISSTLLTLGVLPALYTFLPTARS